MVAVRFHPTTGLMNRLDQPSKDAPDAIPSRSEEALRSIEEYVADLRGNHQKAPQTFELRSPRGKRK